MLFLQCALIMLVFVAVMALGRVVSFLLGQWAGHHHHEHDHVHEIEAAGEETGAEIVELVQD